MSKPRALLSVSDKTGIVDFAKGLAALGWELVSTGGTAKALREAGLETIDVASVTGSPEMMDGRVKTLHPKIHGGILALRDKDTHQQALSEHDITPIDLVALNLYPFAATIASGAAYGDAVEQIDIGGPAMLRASAKNHKFVSIITDPSDYDTVLAELNTNSNATEYSTRQKLAQKAFAHTAGYDAMIANWLAGELGGEAALPLSVQGTLKQSLRYGENPHQAAAFYAAADAQPGLATAEQLQGKELSYNNINDTDAAWQLVAEFDEPAVALIKHANPCGVALGADVTEAFTKALACDSVSAYGGILATNREVDATLVEAIGKLFLEVIIAPAISDDAKETLSAKKNLRILITGAMPDLSKQPPFVKSVLGGYLVQDADAQLVSEEALKSVAKRAPSASEMRDMRFAFAVCKHVKSNAIVIAKDGQTIGIGAGQMSRVDSVRLAGEKARAAKLSTEGCALASDAFFPFDDNVHHAKELGITSLIHPGGSIRDEEVIAAADSYDMAMLLTGERHFKH